MRKIEQVFNYPLTPQVFSCYRLMTKNKNMESIPVLIRFFDPNYKMAFIQKVKNRRATAADFGGSPLIRIFANEHLTKTMSIIYREALRLRNLVGFKYVWCKNGEVFVRRNAYHDYHQIKSLKQLYKVYNTTPSLNVKVMMQRMQ